ncbi:MAG: serine/threonine-protein phosphatase [Deltaproteobacteria bacterium]|nr:serine/threonine-protein phosphatase [Deltaproteobacteria bacterium]
MKQKIDYLVKNTAQLGQDIRITIAQATDVGVEREENQDYFAWHKMAWGQLFVVTDGMGGEAGGRKAAEMANEVIKERCLDKKTSIPELLESAISEANSQIYDLGHSNDPRYHKMGTTVVVLALTPDGLVHVAHVGDSRIYLFRDGALTRLTKDHSKVQEMVDHHILTSEQAEDHPDSNIITRVLGKDKTVQVEFRPQPIPIKTGDVFLLCTDGLCGYVKDPEIEAYLSIEKTLKSLIEASWSKGGYDNVTVQLVRIDAAPEKIASNNAKMEKGLERPSQTPKNNNVFSKKVVLMMTAVGLAGVILGAITSLLVLKPDLTKVLKPDTTKSVDAAKKQPGRSAPQSATTEPGVAPRSPDTAVTPSVKGKPKNEAFNGRGPAPAMSPPAPGPETQNQQRIKKGKSPDGQD